MDKAYDPELGEGQDEGYRNDYGSYTESGPRRACVRCTGAFCWVFLGLVVFFVLVSYIPVSGVTEAPAYARTLIYMSLGCVCHKFITMLKSRLTSFVCLAGTTSTTYKKRWGASAHHPRRFSDRVGRSACMSLLPNPRTRGFPRPRRRYRAECASTARKAT